METSPQMQQQRAEQQARPYEVALWIIAVVGIVLGVILNGLASGQLGDAAASDAYWNAVFADIATRVGTLSVVGALILGGLRNLRDR